MNEQELLNAWESYDAKLESALAVNRVNTVEITHLKVASHLVSMKPIKWFTIVVGIVWCFVLGGVFSLSLLHSPPHVPFIVFMAALLAINVIAVGMYVFHLVLIDRVDRSAGIVESQRTLARLQASTLKVTSILMLSIPFYASLHLFIPNDAGAVYWVINLVVVAAFTALSLWLFFKIDYKNRNERWFQFLFNDKEWNGVIKSAELLEQIQEYETEI